MKLKISLLSFAVALSSINQSCVVCGIDYYFENEPIYISLEDLKTDISFTKEKKINQTGKIYLYKDYIFIGENNFGIHVIDNSNLENPKKTGFIKIPFNEDIVIKNNILYADTLDEIVSIDISNITKPKIIERVKYQGSQSIYDKFKFVDKDRVEIGYKRIKKFKDNCNFNIGMGVRATVSNSINSATISPPSYNYQGQGGSLARFALVDKYLYTVSTSSLNLFGIENPNKMLSFGSVLIDNNRKDIETIFSYKNNLFMGSRTGAYIYDNTNPQQPTYITKVEHVRSCDPVVVENDKAYVTLRNDSNTCRGGINSLDIIDISDIKNSKIISSTPMVNPSGLAIKSGILYVCDRDEVKIFNAKQSPTITKIKEVKINRPNDIILKNNNQAVIISNEGLYQYDFSTLEDSPDTEPKKISFIKTERDSYFQTTQDSQEYVKVGDNYYYKWYKEYLENN